MKYLLRSNAVMSQAVSSFLQLGSNRSPLVFTGTSLPKTRNFSKTYLLRFPAALFQQLVLKKLTLATGVL